MIYLVILALGLLLGVNHAISKNFLYPPALFTAVWLVSLVGLALSGDSLYPISAETLMVFLTGAVAFSIGGLFIFSGQVTNHVEHVYFTPIQVKRIHRSLDFFFLVVLIGLPFYWLSVMKYVNFSDPLLLAKQRAISLKNDVYNPLGNLVIIAICLAVGMHLNNDGSFPRKWRAYLTILLAVIYGGLTGTKGNAVILILTLAFISFMRAGRINFRVLGVTIALVLVVFATGLFLVNFAYMGLDLSVETFWFLVDVIQTYWFGGLVAFERIVQSPDSIESAHHLNRFFLETANGFGASFSVPSIHADFTDISLTQRTNTYTIYFSYFKDHGWLGLVLGMLMLGSMLTWIYNKARHGNPIAVVFYGINAVGLVFSFRAEHFVLALNFYLKTFIFFYIVYYGAARLSKEL